MCFLLLCTALPSACALHLLPSNLHIPSHPHTLQARQALISSPPTCRSLAGRASCGGNFATSFVAATRRMACRGPNPNPGCAVMYSEKDEQEGLKSCLSWIANRAEPTGNRKRNEENESWVSVRYGQTTRAGETPGSQKGCI